MSSSFLAPTQFFVFLRIPKFFTAATCIMMTTLLLCTATRRTGVSAWMTTRSATTTTTATRRIRSASSSSRWTGSFPGVARQQEHHAQCRIAAATSARFSMIPLSLSTTSFTMIRSSEFTRNTASTTSTRLFSTTSSEEENEEDSSSLFVKDATFETVGIQTPVLLERLAKLGLERPTKVQAETFAKLARPSTSAGENEDGDAADDDDDDDDNNNKFQPKKRAKNVIIGSETGSGKTLAYLLPLLDDILQQKKEQHEGQRAALTYDYARAIILVPNKELVQQVLRMAVPLCGDGPPEQSIIWSGGTQMPAGALSSKKNKSGLSPEHQVVRLAVLPGGLMEPLDFKPFRDTVALGGGTEHPVDLIISTPAALGPLALKPKHIDMFADIETLVVDEADMLLDGGYIRPLENVLMGFRRADRLDPSMGVPPTQHVFCAATLPDMGLKSVDAYLQRKFPYAERVQMSGMHNARHYGLKQATQWIGPVETKKERMDQLVEMLETPVEEGGLLGEKVMVFLNSVDDVEGAQSALDKEGISSVPYHAKIKLDERAEQLDRFRRYDSSAADGGDKKKADDSVSVLVCTDLASRGLDVPGVNAVVQLQFSGNVVSHLHRMGRCGRAGQRTGRGIVFFNEAEAELVEVVQEAEDQQAKMVLEGDVDDQLGEEDGGEESGKVQKAFSRKRGFTKKRKKLKREIQPE